MFKTANQLEVDNSCTSYSSGRPDVHHEFERSADVVLADMHEFFDTCAYYGRKYCGNF